LNSSSVSTTKGKIHFILRDESKNRQTKTQEKKLKEEEEKSCRLEILEKRVMQLI